MVLHKLPRARHYKKTDKELEDTMNYNNKTMHPEDKQNLIIFFICCFGVIISFDIFIHQPRMERIKAAQEMAASQTANQQPTAPQLTRDDALTMTNRITIDSDTLQGSIRVQGGRIDDLSLKNYATEPQGDDMVDLLNPADGPFGY